MPYYIYQVREFPIRQLQKLQQHDSYRAASASVKQLRTELAAGAAVTIKMIHAESELQAEDLLNQVRDPAPELGDD
jgi:hypothetical protein